MHKPPIRNMRKLAIYEGSVTTPGGALKQERLVLCPNHTSVTLEACVLCHDNAGRSIDLPPLRSFVLCRVPPHSRAWSPQALVADVMATQGERASERDSKTPACSVDVRDPVSSIVELMVQEGVEQLTVVADDAGAVGVVTALDVVRWFASR